MDEWIATKCDQIRGNGPLALVNCKEILTEVGAVMWDDLQAKTAKRISRVRVSPEGQEGLKAFLEKRKPNWVSGSE
jgi:methylglutaconyl-CoA hydratase